MAIISSSGSASTSSSASYTRAAAPRWWLSMCLPPPVAQTTTHVAHAAAPTAPATDTAIARASGITAPERNDTDTAQPQASHGPIGAPLAPAFAGDAGLQAAAGSVAADCMVLGSGPGATTLSSRGSSALSRLQGGEELGRASLRAVRGPGHHPRRRTAARERRNQQRGSTRGLSHSAASSRAARSDLGLRLSDCRSISPGL